MLPTSCEVYKMTLLINIEILTNELNCVENGDKHETK